MATRYATAFQWAVADMAAEQYAMTSGVTIATSGGRRAGSRFFSNGSAAGALIRKNISGSETTMFQSVAVNPGSLANTFTILSFFEGSTQHVTIACDTSGRVAAYRGSHTGTLLGTSAGAYFSAGAWKWIQAKVLVADSGGTVEVRDNTGAVLLNLSSLDTRNAGTSGVCDAVQLGGTTNPTQLIQWQDWHVWDSTGSLGNTWTDDTSCRMYYGVADGDVSQFTLSAGSQHFAVLDEEPYNATDYADSATNGHQELLVPATMNHNPPTIIAVIPQVVAQSTDAGTDSIKLLTKRSGTVYASAAQALTQGTYLRHEQILNADPSTSAAWTQANFNAAQFGFEKA